MPFFLRVPKTAHARDYRLVPVAGCGCRTCIEVRRENLLDDAHGAKVANILDIEAHGACRCGRGLDADGECLAGRQCPYAHPIDAVEEARRI